MTKIEQIDWSKFKQYEPKQPATATPPGTKSFKKIKETRKGHIKSYRMVDKHLIGEQIANYNHLRSIKDEA